MRVRTFWYKSNKDNIQSPYPKIFFRRTLQHWARTFRMSCLVILGSRRNFRHLIRLLVDRCYLLIAKIHLWKIIFPNGLFCSIIVQAKQYWIQHTPFSKKVLITGLQLYSFMVPASKDIPSMISHSVDIIQGGFFGNSKSSFNQSFGIPKKQECEKLSPGRRKELE